MIGRLPVRAKVLLLAGIPVVGTLVLALLIAQQARTQTAAADALGSIENVAELSVHISGAMHALQLERARAALDEGYAEHHGLPRGSVQELENQRARTDRAVQRLGAFLASHDLSELPSRLARGLTRATKQIRKREEFEARLSGDNVPVHEILTFYNEACDALIHATAALTELSDDGELLRSISSLVALAQLSERASREHALLSFVFAVDEFPPGAFKELVTLTTERGVYAATFRSGARGGEAVQFDNAQKTAAATRASGIRSRALEVNVNEVGVEAKQWFYVAADELAGLHEIEQMLLREIARAASAKLADARVSLRLGGSLSIAVVVLSGTLAWIIARGVTRSIVDLSSAAARVRETNDFGIRAHKTSSDELGTLTDMFNEMLTMIEQRDGYLEAQVAARTEELRKALAELWTEMDLATKIQTVLLPQDPDLPTYQISAKMITASSVGGDYYDAFRVDGVDWILIGDVSGHGVTAGLTMMLVQTSVRTVLFSAGDRAHEITPKQLLTHVNAAVRSNIQKISPDQYMTIMALRLDGSRVTYSGLHQDVLVYRARSSEVERVPTRGIWLGLVDDVEGMLDDDTFEVADGDIILLYTDGVTEVAAESNLLGTDGLASILAGAASSNPLPDAVVKSVTERVCVGTPDDDVTVLAARFEPLKAAKSGSEIMKPPHLADTSAA